ncbi:Folylpolyglutamate synthetase [Friedmanniomyces endolithicus]|nr:Folylpolyglutamate synthetase [Friedmanniomyces endolithicus]
MTGAVRLHGLPRSYAKALTTLNTFQRRASASTERNVPNLSPRQKISAWLEILGLDINRSCYIHVAGTKGKGTTCLYTENLIQTYNQKVGIASKVGCLTSSHVTTVRERILVDAQPITEESFTFHFWTLWKNMRPAEPTVRLHAASPPMPGYPGFITLLAFHIFVEEAVGVVILETGMGGETDSTNVITSPMATGITELGLDHTNRLGNKLESIAWHKSGIFKPDAPAFSVPQQEAAARILRGRACEKSVELHFVDKTFISNNHITIAPNEKFQRHNASLALALAGVYVFAHAKSALHFVPSRRFQNLEHSSRRPEKLSTCRKKSTRMFDIPKKWK